ncbi:hypothetical protein [Streptomyces sp. NPDC058486]|uniref:hypothetical protein n=1 Tax=unclassified Streptomyces TaxID=2593676 RepID=UPI003648B9A5
MNAMPPTRVRSVADACDTAISATRRIRGLAGTLVESLKQAPYSAFLLGSLQVSLAFFLLAPVYFNIRPRRAGVTQFTRPSAAMYGCTLLCGVGLIPGWTGRFAIVAPCAASAVVLICLFDSPRGRLVNTAVGALIVLIACLIALAHIHSAASLDGSFWSWTLTGSGVFLLMVCVLSSSTDSVPQRVGHATMGLANTAFGLALMTS